jgi:hypothetical protein
VNAVPRRPVGWLILALAACAWGTALTLTCLWQVGHGRWGYLLLAPIDLMLVYWIGLGAWRRTHPPQDDTAP